MPTSAGAGSDLCNPALRSSSSRWTCRERPVFSVWPCTLSVRTAVPVCRVGCMDAPTQPIPRLDVSPPPASDLSPPPRQECPSVQADGGPRATRPISSISTGSRASNGHRRSKSNRSSLQVTDAPPFWTRHGRSVSNVSYQSLAQTRPPAIQLEDHSEEDHEQTQGCWARSVTVDDYVVISGQTGIGAYIVWNCTVSTLKGGDLSIRKRYVQTSSGVCLDFTPSSRPARTNVSR